MSKTPTVAFDPKQQRKALGLNQSLYWSRVQVTQSGGSRYESGRKVPAPIKLLLDIAYGDNPQAIVKKLRAEH